MQKLISPDEMAEILGKNRAGLRRLVRLGLPHVAIGPRTKLFDADAVEAWLAPRTVRYVEDEVLELLKNNTGGLK